MKTNKKIIVSAVVGGFLITALGKKISERKKKRKTWSRNWLRERSDGKGVLAMLDNELLLKDPISYRNFLRMDSAQFKYVLGLIENSIKKQDTHFREAISSKNRLEITLRFLATGETFRSLMYGTRIHESTISRIIPEVCDAIYEALKGIYLQTPNTADAWNKIATDFYELWNYPHCLGALDGRHITFRPPVSDGSYYFNYKGNHSIVLLGLADSHYRFIYVNVGVNGRISDGGVFQSSALSQALETNTLNFPSPAPLPGRTLKVPYVIIGDDAFPLLNNLMKPYPQRNLNFDCRIHNYRLSRARRIIENSFGILANRFRVLLNPINLSAAKVVKITLPCITLHNYLATKNNNLYIYQNSTETLKKTLPKICQQGSSMSAGSSRIIRDEFKNFFMSPMGKVGWQENSVKNSNW